MRLIVAAFAISLISCASPGAADADQMGQSTQASTPGSSTILRRAAAELKEAGLDHCPADPPSELKGIIGKWESGVLSVAGVGNELEFCADGTFTRTFVVMADGRYRVEGTSVLISTFGRASGEPADSISIDEEPNGDILTERDAATGRLMRLTRLTKQASGSRSIVGRWSGMAASGPMAGATFFEEYTEDGRFSYRMPFSSRQGRYAVAGDALTIRLGRQTTYRFQLRAGRLIVRRVIDGVESQEQYSRVRQGV